MSLYKHEAIAAIVNDQAPPSLAVVVIESVGSFMMAKSGIKELAQGHALQGIGKIAGGLALAKVAQNQLSRANPIPFGY